jgi:hypothetical protein
MPVIEAGQGIGHSLVKVDLVALLNALLQAVSADLRFQSRHDLIRIQRAQQAFVGTEVQAFVEPLTIAAVTDQDEGQVPGFFA